MLVNCRSPVRLQPSARIRSGNRKARNTMALAGAQPLKEEAEKLVNDWLSRDTDPATRNAAASMVAQENYQGIIDSMAGRLEFGTAGLRGKLGPGYNRMNHITVQQTTQGLVTYLSQSLHRAGSSLSVAIGCDARHQSRRFADIVAAVCISKGLHVHMYQQVVPTPFVAAAVPLLKCDAGVMITASHNPREYNGYKVYWGNGCQIIPPHDAGIAAAIDANLELWPLPESVGGSELVSDPFTAVTDWYYRTLAERLSFRTAAANAASAPVVYTPLHGVGALAAKRAFKVFGLPEPILVAEQAEPDPDFPTVSFPNPEEGAGTWALAFATAERHGTSLVLANDPDADRLAAAERIASSSPPDGAGGASGGWRSFSGNEIGILLAHWIWTNHRRQHPEVPASSCAMLASAVSSRMLAAMAEREGFVFEQTLTGFKWLGNRALQLEAQGLHVLFAFEEAIGFMFGDLCKDKDGIAGAAVFAEMAGALAERGVTVQQHLHHLYRTYGFFCCRSGYFIADSPAKSRAVFDRLRAGGQYPKELAGVPITGVRDLGTGLDTSQPDQRATLPWIPGDMMITFTLQGGGTLTVRASGTEPKLKYYLEVTGQDQQSGDALADRLRDAVADDIVQVQRHGLALPQH